MRPSRLGASRVYRPPLSSYRSELESSKDSAILAMESAVPQTFLALFLLGSAGAVAGEVLKLYELRGKLTSAKYRALATSPLFWGVFGGMLAASGFIAWAVNSTAPDPTPLQVILSGIGARGLVRGAAEARTANASPTLGDSNQVKLRDLLA
jgi:hypothetical protein